jgi:poly-gamma-glutamate capsule biosynthesis protein CapA/YwtB (metallophosphatase superfamily)
MMSRFVIFAGYVLAFLSGCSSPAVEVQWVSGGEALLPVSRVSVSFRDGSELVASSVTRVGERKALAEFWFSPGVRSQAAGFALKLFPTDGAKAIDLEPLSLGPLTGALARVTFEIEDSVLAKRRGHWVSIRLLTPEGESIKAPPFPGHWVSIGVIEAPGVTPSTFEPDIKQRLSLVFGGDTNLGRRQNGITGAKGSKDALGQLSGLFDADLAFVNLECVLADGGDLAVPKSEPVPFYFRGRREQVQVLVDAGIDVVGTANNHAGDYGADALVEQAGILNAAGVLGVGTGENLAQACSPVFIERKGVRVGFVSADTTLGIFGAGASKPGTCHVSKGDVAAAMAVLGPAITQAKAEADVVFVAMHWGKNRKSRPSKATRRLGAALIRAGADAILGSSAHQLQGVEIVDGRPILYDAGNLLFDSHANGEMARSGVFRLDFDHAGVHRVEMSPIDLDYGFSRPAQGNSAARSLVRFRDLSKELGTAVHISNGVARVDLPAPPAREPMVVAGELLDLKRASVGPLEEAPPGCVVDAVPPDAVIEPISWGPMKLIGFRMRPALPMERRTVWVETWWTLAESIQDDLWIYQRMKSLPHRPASMWWADHEHCDWAWPTSRWTMGQIIKDEYGVRPPKSAEAGRYELVMGLIRNEQRIGAPVRLTAFQYQ